MDELVVGERDLRVVVAPVQQRVARQTLEVPPVLLDVLAVVALRPGQAEHPLLQDRVLAVPEREREAELVADVRDAGHPVLVPAVRAGAGVVVRERAPRRRRPRSSPRGRCPMRARSGTGPHSYHGFAEKRSSSARPVASASRACSAVAGVLESASSVLRGVEWRQVEEVPGPGIEGDVEPVAEVVAAALVGLAARRRRRAATPGRGGRPRAARRGLTPARRRGSRPRACVRLAAPAPGDEVLPRVVAVPAASLAELPLAVAEDGVAERASAAARRTPCSSGSACSSGRRARKTGSCTRAALELALVDEPRAGLAQRRHGGGARLLARERRRRARLVVVLDEADEPLLVVEVGVQVPAARPRRRSCTRRS